MKNEKFIFKSAVSKKKSDFIAKYVADNQGKHDFASSTVITTNYVGRDTEMLIYNTLFGAYTLRQTNSLEVVQRDPNGSKDSVVVHKVDLTNLRQSSDSACGLAASGSFTSSDVKIDLKKYIYKFEACTEKFIGTWYSSQMTSGAKDEELPQTIEDWIAQRISEQMGSDIDRDIWVGQTGVSGSQINGILTQIIQSGAGAGAGTSGTCVDVVSGTTLTQANIRTEMAKAINSYMQNNPVLFATGRARLYMNTGDLGLYETTLAVASVETAPNLPNRVSKRFAGVDIIDSPNITAGQMIVTDYTNIAFFTDLISDWEDVRILDLAAAGRVGEFQFYGAVRYNVYVKNLCEVVYYRP